MSSSWKFCITCSTCKRTSHANNSTNILCSSFSFHAHFHISPSLGWLAQRFKNCISTVEFLRSLPKAEVHLMECQNYLVCSICFVSSNSDLTRPHPKMVAREGKSRLVKYDKFGQIFWAHSCCRIFDEWKGMILSGRMWTLCELKELHRWSVRVKVRVSLLRESYFKMKMLAEIPANLEFAESRSCQGWTYFIAARTNVDETCTKGAECSCRRVWKLQSSPSCSEFFIDVVLLIGGWIECWWPDGEG